MPSIDPSTSEDLNQQDGSGMSRRSVVRAGVAAAWAVPLVQVAAAAPSFAASGPAKLDTSTSGNFTRNGKNATLPSVVVKNTNTQATVGLTLTITITSAGNTFDTTPTAPGWTGSPVTAATKTVTLTRNSQVNGNTNASAVTVTLHLSNATGTTITSTLTTTGGTGQSFGTMSA